jgi:hypothetical protein
MLGFVEVGENPHAPFVEGGALTRQRYTSCRSLEQTNSQSIFQARYAFSDGGPRQADLFGRDRKTLCFRDMDENVDVLDPIDRHGVPSYPGGLSASCSALDAPFRCLPDFFGILGNFVPK